jgi:homoserine O-acetyltransferase
MFTRYFFLFFLLISSWSFAAQYPNQKEGVWTAKDFQFHTGQTMQDLKVGYITLGDPSKPAVLILHGTAGSAKSMLVDSFAGQLFAKDQSLDAEKYFIIIPDAIGVGKSSKPSDGLRTKFPRYDYNDMVQAQYRLVTEGLGIKHLNLIIGNSMGGMQTWIWGTEYPQFMDGLVAMASTPIAMGGRNWILRKFISETVRQDPAWNNGNYVNQPPSARLVNNFYGFASSGGSKHLQYLAPNSEKADALIEERLKAPFPIDANDFLYQWESSADFDPSANLEKIEAKVLAINSADDERNPPELGLMQKQLQRIHTAELYLIPSSEQTMGHGTTMQAKWWKEKFTKWLSSNQNN